MSSEPDVSPRPQTLMLNSDYDPARAMGALKPPIFQTANFLFKSAEDGKRFFAVAHGHQEADENEEAGYIYSRVDNPNLRIVEDRLKIWDGADECCVFSSGMAAITTVLLEFLRPGDLLLMSNPIYGESDCFVREVLAEYGVRILDFKPEDTAATVIERVERSGFAKHLALIYMETPANPTNGLFDIEEYSAVARHFSRENKPVYLAVDNTFLGPLWQHPLRHGADFVLYSATKYIGGHSDVVAGACLGAAPVMKRVRRMRALLGNMTDAHTAWLLTRSLETLQVRMEAQQQNAQRIAAFLRDHPAVEKVYYLGVLSPEDERQYAIKQKQCQGDGSMISFDIKGTEKEAFAFLDALRLVKLAVSLGSTESLAQHPATMSHVDVDEALKRELSITEKMIRLSVGIEHCDDLIADLEQALQVIS